MRCWEERGNSMGIKLTQPLTGEQRVKNEIFKLIVKGESHYIAETVCVSGINFYGLKRSRDDVDVPGALRESSLIAEIRNNDVSVDNAIIEDNRIKII